jgi:hypothetical protein
VDFSAGMIEDGSELLCMTMVMFLAIGLVTNADEQVRLSQGREMGTRNS